MFLIPLLQPVAPAHVSERYRKKANRHHYENNVQHRCSLLAAARNGAPQSSTGTNASHRFSFSPTSLPSRNSKFVNQVQAEEELVTRLSVIECRQIPRVIEAQFGTQHHRGADVFRGIHGVFRIFRNEPGSLTLDVIQEVRPESDEELWIDVAIHVVDDRVF